MVPNSGDLMRLALDENMHTPNLVQTGRVQCVGIFYV